MMSDEERKKGIGDMISAPAMGRANGCVRDRVPCQRGKGRPRRKPGGICVSRGSRLVVRGRALLGARGEKGGGGGGRGRGRYASSLERRGGAGLSWSRRVLAYWENSVESCPTTVRHGLRGFGPLSRPSTTRPGGTKYYHCHPKL